MQAITFNPAQMHVLNLASHIKTQESLDLLKDQLAAFYAKMIDDQMDELWESGQWNMQKLEELRNAHFRTEYKRWSIGL